MVWMTVVDVEDGLLNPAKQVAWSPSIAVARWRKMVQSGDDEFARMRRLERRRKRFSSLELEKKLRMLLNMMSLRYALLMLTMTNRSRRYLAWLRRPVRVADREGLALSLALPSVVSALEVGCRIVNSDGGLELRDEERVAGLGLRGSEASAHMLKAFAGLQFSFTHHYHPSFVLVIPPAKARTRPETRSGPRPPPP